MRTTHAIIAIATLVPLLGHGQEAQDTCKHHGNIVERLIEYLDDANKPQEEKAFDFSLIAGPHYSSDKGFGIGVVAAGLYRIDKEDKTIQPSSVSLYGDAATKMFFKVGIEGVNIFPHDRFRLEYDVNFSSFDTYFWGIGYDMASNDANKSRYKYLKSEALVNFTYRVAPNLYFGPMAAFDYVYGHKMERPELWMGEKPKTLNFGAGVTLRYDTRDYITNAYRGVYVAIDQKFYPRFLANAYGFGMTDLTAAYYRMVWQGGVIATHFNTRMTYGDTPWGLLSTFGGSDTMRGYYEGRYADKCSMTLCLELRQRVWHRNGLVVWGGAGTIFPKFKDFNIHHLLPNYGIGYRWEFKQRVNVRLDMGFGKGCSSFIFSINEAF